MSALYTVVLVREEMARWEPKIINSRGEGERLQKPSQPRKTV